MVQKTYGEKIRALAEPVVEAEGMELILAECLKMKSQWVVRLYLDKAGGVTLDDCAAISTQLGDILDVNDIPPGRYTLEVSSPGLDRPLDRDQDFLKYRGAKVFIRVDEKLNGIRNFRGILADLVCEDGNKTVIVDVAGEKHLIPRDKITKAHLEFDL